MGIRSSILAILILALAGCFDTPVQSGVIACGEGGLCPDGLDCIAGLCRLPGTVVADASTDAADPIDAAMPDAEPPLGPFSAGVRIAELDNGDGEDDPSVTGDLLEIYYNHNNLDIYRATRASTSDPWGSPVDLTALGDANEPYVLEDGLTLYFASTRNGTYDIFRTTRATRQDAWGAPVAVGPPISQVASGDRGPCITPDDTVMIFASDRDGTYHLYRSSRPTPGDSWAAPVQISSINGVDGIELDCWVSGDEKTFFFGSDRSGGTGPINTWEAVGDGSGGYSMVQEAAGINAAATVTVDPYLSPDRRTIFFAAQPDGLDADLYMATR